MDNCLHSVQYCIYGGVLERAYNTIQRMVIYEKKNKVASCFGGSSCLWHFHLLSAVRQNGDDSLCGRTSF